VRHRGACAGSEAEASALRRAWATAGGIGGGVAGGVLPPENQPLRALACDGRVTVTVLEIWEDAQFANRALPWLRRVLWEATNRLRATASLDPTCGCGTGACRHS